MYGKEWRMEEKTSEALTFKDVFVGFLLSWSDLSPFWAYVT